MKAITTKFHGPTDTRGSRVSATDMDGNRVTVNYDHSASFDDRHWAAARALCEKMNWHGELVRGSIKSGEVFVFVSERDRFTV